MVHNTTVIKISQNDIGRSYCTAQAVRYALISLHLMFNLTHTKASNRGEHAVYVVDKDSDYWGRKIIRFKNIFQVYPMVMIPRYVSKNDR